MEKEISEYAARERIGVIAVRMPDGTPHAATVHYAHTDEPLTFIIKTSKSYRKMEAFTEGNAVPAGMVIGTNEGNMQTFQLDGTARRMTDADAELMDAYFAKFPEKSLKPDDDVFIAFTPSWWRFTDWTKGGKTIRLSTD